MVLGFALRYTLLANENPLAQYTDGGGDNQWYLANGEGIVSGRLFGESSYGLKFYNSVIPTAPVYLIYVGGWQLWLDGAGAIWGIWLSQIVLSLATAVLCGLLAWRISGQERAFWLATLVITFEPSNVIMPTQILTETLYVFFIMSGLWLYVRSLASASEGSVSRWGLVSAGATLGLATLTRAVGLLFPLGLLFHLGMVYFAMPQRAWRAFVLSGLLLIGAYSAVVSTWTIHNLSQFNRFVIASDQFMPSVWRGAVTTDGSPQENDAQLLRPEDFVEGCESDCGVKVPNSRYVEQVSAVITSDIGGYVRLRLTELAESYSLPAIATILGGESLRQLLQDWAGDGFSLEGLQRLISGDNFWQKLLLYVMHFVGIILGLVGAWRARRAWRTMLPVLGFIAYTTLIHIVVLALPRYILPTLFCFWVLVPMAFFPPKEHPIITKDNTV